MKKHSRFVIGLLGLVCLGWVLPTLGQRVDGSRGASKTPVEAQTRGRIVFNEFSYSGRGIVVETADGTVIVSPGENVREHSFALDLRLSPDEKVARMESADTVPFPFISGQVDLRYNLSQGMWYLYAKDDITDETYNIRLVHPVSGNQADEVAFFRFVAGFFEYLASDDPGPSAIIPVQIAGTTLVCPDGKKCCQAAEYCLAVCGLNETPSCNYSNGRCVSTCKIVAV